MPSLVSLGRTATLSKGKTDTERLKALKWCIGQVGKATSKTEMSVCCFTVWHLSIQPSSTSIRRGRFYCFYLMSGSGLGCRHTACGALPLSFLERNSIAFFLVHKILMILIIAIIMIAIVTVNVVITGIIIMNTCFLLLFSLMLILMGYLFFLIFFFYIFNQYPNLLFPCLKNSTHFSC